MNTLHPATESLWDVQHGSCKQRTTSTSRCIRMDVVVDVHATEFPIDRHPERSCFARHQRHLACKKILSGQRQCVNIPSPGQKRQRSHISNCPASQVILIRRLIHVWLRTRVINNWKLRVSCGWNAARQQNNQECIRFQHFFALCLSHQSTSKEQSVAQQLLPTCYQKHVMARL